MEDPFSVLNVFVPEPPARPQVTPLYPLTATTALTPIITTDGTQPQSQMSQPRIHAPTPVIVPSNRPSPVLSTLSNIPTQNPTAVSTSTPPARPPKRRCHWTIVRNVPARSRGKDKDGETTVDDALTTWKVPRDAGPADYGSFATFLGELAASAVGPITRAGVGGAGISAAEYMYGSEPRLFATIRSTIEHRGAKRKHEAEADDAHAIKNGEQDTESFWTDERAEEAWDFLRDVVYGGVDGYAYVRSLAEFVAPSIYLNDACKVNGEDMDVDVDEKRVFTPPENRDAVLPLGVPLARYVEDNLVDTVTRGRHGWLRDVLLPAATIAFDPACANGDVPPSPFHLHLATLPGAARAMASSQGWYKEPLDMAALIQSPEELANESALEGGPGEGGEHAEIERALAWSVEVFEKLGRRVRKDEPGENGDHVIVKEEAMEDGRVVDGEDEEGVSAMDVDGQPEPEGESDGDPNRPRSQPALGPDASTKEDPLVTRLRLNLLALAKRAPLDQIAKLPVELVPERIRGIVPTA